MNVCVQTTRRLWYLQAILTKRLASSSSDGNNGKPLLPSVRHLLSIHSLDAKDIAPTGAHGRLSKGDVLHYLSNKPVAAANAKVQTLSSKPIVQAAPKQLPKPTPNDKKTFEDVETSNIRKVIAKRLTESKTTIPYSYISSKCVVDNLINTRKQFNETRDNKVSLNDFLIKAAALALREVPEANASWTADAIRMHRSVDVCVAVATDKGLIAPIVKDADTKSLGEIVSEVKTLAGKARDGKLQPSEFQGGTFSISNLGMYGIDNFSAIINPPQALILAVGGTKPEVFIPIGGNVKQMQVVNTISLTLSIDSRAVTEETASKFLDALISRLEHPYLLLN